MTEVLQYPNPAPGPKLKLTLVFWRSKSQNPPGAMPWGWALREYGSRNGWRALGGVIKRRGEDEKEKINT